jgi:cytochrome c556
MGRKSLLKSTKKKPVKPKKAAVEHEAERKKAILDGVPHFPGSVKAALKNLGLAQSTYYQWLQRFKADGIDGLKSGGPVSDKVWKQFNELQKKQEKPARAEGKLQAEEKPTMTSKKDKEKAREILFKRFDDVPSKPPQKEAGPKKGQAPEPAEIQGPKEPLYSPPPEAPPEAPMDKTLKYAIGAFVLVIAILVMASLSNSNKFYFKKNQQMIELWQGKFAPMGESRVASFSDSKILEGLPEQKLYNKRQAFDAVSNYFIRRADKILNTGQTPDLKSARSSLIQASRYAVTDSTRQAVQLRLKSINRVKDDLQTYIKSPEPASK